MNRTSSIFLMVVFFAAAFLVCSFTTAVVRAESLTPIGWWQGEGNANDQTGLNNGTLMNGATFAPGKVGQAFRFDGVDDYVLIGDPVPSSLQIQNEITLEAWIYATAYPPGNNLGLIVGSQYDTNLAGATIFLDGRTSPDGQPSPPGHIHFQIGDGSSWHTTNVNAQVPLNQWVFIVATRKAGESANVYYNGVLQPLTSVPWAGTISYNGAWFAVGQQKDLYRPFNGLIDEVKIYDRALSAEEVLAEYEAVVPATLNIIDATYGEGAGSFELGNFVNGGGNPFAAGPGYMGLLPGDNTTMTGWTVGGPGDGVDWLISPFFGADTGVHSVDLQHLSDSSIATLIPTVAGNVYKLSFGAAAFSGYSNTGIVSAGSLVNQPFTAPFSSAQSTQTFAPFTFLFNATGPTTEIRFTATGPNTDYGPVIDSVSVVLVSDFFGGTLKTASNYEFSLAQGTQKTESIQLINPGSISRSATLEIVNPNLGLSVFPTQPNPISIAPGETVDIPIALDAGSLPVGVYDGILLKVTADDGSTLYSNIKVYITAGAEPLPDLAISSNDISSATNADGSVTLTANVHNQGTAPASNVQVQFYEFGNSLGTPVVAQVPVNGIGTASITVPSTDPLAASGDHLVRVVVDPSGAIQELDKTNNEASQIVRIGSPSPTEGNILVTGSLPSTVYADSLFTLTGQAVYAININGTTNTDYVVKGGAVQITVSADGGASWVYGDVHTDVNGNFSKSLQAPASPGTYHISMTVTDQTFIGTRDLVFNVIPAPAPGSPPPSPPLPPTTSGTGYWTFDPAGGPSGTWTWTWTSPPDVPGSDLRVFSEDIHFSKNNPAANEEITLFAEIHYWATSTALVAHNVPVNIYVTYPGSPRVKIGQTVIDSLSTGSPDFGSRYVYATWKNNQGQGIYIVEVEIDPSYVEANMLNNAATRAIIVGQLQSGLGAISGQVTDALNGVGGVMIHVLGANGVEIGNAATDSTGFYLVKDVPLSTLQVHIDIPSGYVADAETKTVTVSAQSVSTVDFHLTKQADTTPPVITAAATTAANGNGWYNSNVTVHFTCSDAGSGIAPGACPADEILSAEGSSVSSTAQTVTDRAGNTSAPSNVVTAKIDKTPPTVTGSASPTANGNGWNNGAVTVSFACNDATSGIATCTAAQTLGGEGANQSVSGTATDKAGNSASTQVTGINIDLTAPVVSVTGVTNGATYTLGSVPAAGCTTTDAISGVQTNATPSVTGGSSNGTGTFTASCTGAMDKAGNLGAASVTYQVNAAPPSACSTFSTFGVNLLGIDQRLKTFFLLSNFTLGQDSNGIAPVKDTVTLTIANFTTTIPAGSFRKGPAGVYAFAGKINNVSIEALITPLGGNRFGFQTAAYGANLSGTKNPVTVGLTIGDDCGTTSVNAVIK